MLLTRILFTLHKGYLKTGRLTKGHMYGGKDRLVRPVDIPKLIRLRQDFEREEQNMLLLRHPYLTKKESRGHNKENRLVTRTSQKFIDYKLRRFSKVITTESRLGHLQVNESWDV